MSRRANHPDFVTQDTGVSKRVCGPPGGEIVTPFQAGAIVASRVGRLGSRAGVRSDRNGDSAVAPVRDICPRYTLETTGRRQADSVRVRRLGERVPRPPLHDLLLPDRDAVHRVRYRDRVPLPAGPAHARPGHVRVRRDGRLHRAAGGGLRVRVEEGRPRMAVTPVSISKAVRAGDLAQYVMLTTLEKAMAWTSSNSIWPAGFGLACCAIEMMSLPSPRYDIARFGSEVFRSSPRQADLMIVSGRVSHKMVAPLRQVYDQMLLPKWVMAMGACSSSGGMFANYAILQGVDKVVPVDVHVPGCPPRPEAVVDGLLLIQKKIRSGIAPAYVLFKLMGRPPRSSQQWSSRPCLGRCRRMP